MSGTWYCGFVGIGIESGGIVICALVLAGTLGEHASARLRHIKPPKAKAKAKVEGKADVYARGKQRAVPGRLVNREYV